MQSQRTLVDEIGRLERRRLESLPELAGMEPFEVAIADIARTTSLDFGVLVDADEKGAGGMESRRGRRLTQASVDSLARSLSRASRSSDDEDGEYRRDGHDRDRLRQLITDVAENRDRLLKLLDGR
jgi:hypothetical protein